MKKKLLLLMIIICAFSGMGFADEFLDQNLIAKMESKIHELGEENNFVFVDLFTEEEISVFDGLKIEIQEECDRFGDLILLKEEVPAFLRKIGNDDEELIR